MDKEIMNNNARCLEKEYAWFNQVLDCRFHLHFGHESAYTDIREIPVPDHGDDGSMYARVVRHYAMPPAERLLLLLALAPHVKPRVLDPFFTKNSLYDRGFTEFGGITGQQHGGFLPTGETALFLLAGDDLELRFQYMALFDEHHYFFRHNLLKLDTPTRQEPLLSGALLLSQEMLSLLTEQKGEYKPRFSSQFPAKQISTSLEWKDLVLDPATVQEIDEILGWLEHKDTLMKTWALERTIKPGYRALFYGPPGTGKTMTAALLGKQSGLDVYRIDLSQVVSKYIGETEKNLAGIFDRAENNEWILFFDEADALFGKRSSTKDAKDRYANQEVAYLLQRIEDFPGVAILATNLKGNIDEAFARRFQSIVYFPMPSPEQRLHLWRNAFSGELPLDEGIDWSQIARTYELAGGAIINVLQTCALTAVRRKQPLITQQDILQAIRKELRKEGKSAAL